MNLFPDRGIPLVGCDQLEQRPYQKLMGECNTLIHAGAYTSVPDSQSEFSSYIQNNIINTIRMLERVEFKKFIFFSSYAVYNNHGEEKPVSIYGATKLAVEKYIESRNDLACRTWVLRIANPIGLRDCHLKYLELDRHRPRNLFMKLAEACLRNEIFYSHHIPDMTRDFIYIDSVLDFIQKIILDKVPVGTYNVGSGVQTDIMRLISEICSKWHIQRQSTSAPSGTARGYPVNCDKFLEHMNKGNPLKDLDFNTIFDGYCSVLRRSRLY